MKTKISVPILAIAMIAIILSNCKKEDPKKNYSINYEATTIGGSGPFKITYSYKGSNFTEEISPDTTWSKTFLGQSNDVFFISCFPPTPVFGHTVSSITLVITDNSGVYESSNANYPNQANATVVLP